MAAVDRRLAKVAAELEQQVSSVAAEQERRLDAIADDVAVNLRVVSEHLLAIERATRALTDLAAALGGANDGSPLLVVPSGSDATVPEGFVVVETLRCADATVLRLAPSS
jgi:hypothetical protein